MGLARPAYKKGGNQCGEQVAHCQYLKHANYSPYVSIKPPESIRKLQYCLGLLAFRLAALAAVCLAG